MKAEIEPASPQNELTSLPLRDNAIGMAFGAAVLVAMSGWLYLLLRLLTKAVLWSLTY